MVILQNRQAALPRDQRREKGQRADDSLCHSTIISSFSVTHCHPGEEDMKEKRWKTKHLPKRNQGILKGSLNQKGSRVHWQVQVRQMDSRSWGVLCPFHSMKCGRNLEVPPGVVVVQGWVWIVDSGKLQSRKDDYGYLHRDLLLAFATFKKYVRAKTNTILFLQFCRWGLLMHL